MKPVQNERSFSQMSKYKEEISEAKEKNCTGKWEYSSFIEIWNFKLFRTCTIKTKTRACVPSACFQREVFGELISAARVAGKETDLQFIRIITRKQELKNREETWAVWLCLHGERFLRDFSSCRKI